MVLMQLNSTLAAVVREHILSTLANFDGNRTRSAKILDISVRCLRNKLHEYADAGADVPAPSNGVRLPDSTRDSDSGLAH